MMQVLQEQVAQEQSQGAAGYDGHEDVEGVHVDAQVPDDRTARAHGPQTHEGIDVQCAAARGRME